MIKVDTNHNPPLCTREPIFEFLVGLLPESLVDLSWVPEPLDEVVRGICYFPPADEPLPEFDPATHAVDYAAETLVADLDAKVVRVSYGVRPLTEEEIAQRAAEAKAAADALVKQYDGIVQGRLDSVARDTFRYGDPNRPDISPILHAITYAEEPAVPKFQAEGRLLRAWRSKTWVASADILAAVTAGERSVPTESELLVELEQLAPAPTIADVEAEIVRLTTA